MREKASIGTVVSFFVVFLCVRQYFFPGSENSYSSHRFQILHRGKPQIDIKVGFFLTKRNFQLVLLLLPRFSERFTNYYIIDIDPSFQFVVRDDVRVDLAQRKIVAKEVQK